MLERLNRPELCPYCLEYSDRFVVCEHCGLSLCLQRCAVSIFGDNKAVCCDCAHRSSTLYRLALGRPVPEATS